MASAQIPVLAVYDEAKFQDMLLLLAYNFEEAHRTAGVEISGLDLMGLAAHYLTMTTRAGYGSVLDVPRGVILNRRPPAELKEEDSGSAE